MLLPAALAALFVLAGCGIKGPLELPSGVQVSDTDSKQTKGKGEYPRARQLPGYQPTLVEQRQAKQLGKPVKPDEPFFLDPLLK
jgi:predicted small lipoprotein YifL